jgi:membrane associated rhomboid family serine protease
MKTFSLPKNSTLVNLIYINIGVFLAAKLIGIVCTLFNLNSFSALSYLHLTAQINLLLKQPWSVLTYMFLHTDFFHLFFNMICLYGFGKLFLNYFSQKQLVGLYLLGGLRFGAVLAGLSVNAGLGLMVLFKQDKNFKEVVFILSMLILPSLLAGYGIFALQSIF